MTRSDPGQAGPSTHGWKRRLAMALCAAGVLSACVTIRCYWGGISAKADPGGAQVADVQPQATSATTRSAFSSPARPAVAPEPSQAAGPQAKFVANVNGEDISREELAKECLRHHGKEVLDALVHKYMIMLECQRQGISVTQEDVNAEIERISKRFGLPVDQWLKMLKQERGIKPTQYASDIIWPTLALRRLAGERLRISQEELLAEYEMHYGPAVKARLIACSDLEKAKKVQAQAAANPAQFGSLAKTYSEDPGSASLKGMIQPIRKHSGSKEIEQAAFAMKDGEVSQVIPVTGQFVVLQREELIPARNIPLETARPQLEEVLKDRKLRSVSAETFQGLKDTAKVQNVMNDPNLSRQMPGVAALINGNQVTVRELAERCIERHGEDVLEGLINRRILEQACRKNNVAVTDAEIDQEIARVAGSMLRAKADGSPDVETWVKMVTEEQGITVEVYRHDVLWPSVALRKLVEKNIQVAEDDLKKGYEANYGPRVRCRAIILDNLRRAQEVWAKARENPTEEFFGRLAEQYSCEGNNRMMKGEVPPIQMHGGQPVLEREAFNLKPGELSGIIQVSGNKYVVLLCLGRTNPQQVKFEQVRDLIYEDVKDKKLHLAMATYFQDLQEVAAVDNYLAGTSRAPKLKVQKLEAAAPGDEGRTVRRAGSAIPPTR